MTPFRLLCGAGLLAIFSSTISKSPVLPLFASYLGADPAGVGVIASISAFTGIVVSIPAGLLSDRWGRKRMLLFSVLVFSTAPFLYLIVTHLWQLALVRFYHGLATAIFIPVAMALVSDLFQQGRGEKLGWFSTSTLLGRFMAPIIGGSLIGFLVLNPSLGFKAVYLVCGLAGILAFFLVFKLPEPSAIKKHREPLRETLRIFKKVMANPGISFTSGMEAAVLFAYGTFETFLPIYSIKIGLSAYEVGIFLSAQVITLALTKPIMGRFSDRHGRKPQILAGALMGALCIGGLGANQILFPFASFEYPVRIEFVDCDLGDLGPGGRLQPERNLRFSHGDTRLHYGYRPYRRPLGLRDRRQSFRLLSVFYKRRGHFNSRGPCFFGGG